jgi:hypothetical protein
MDLVAGSSELDRAFVITLKREAVVVEAVAVGFNHDALRQPDEVDEMTRDDHVDKGRWKPGLATQDEKIELER